MALLQVQNISVAYGPIRAVRHCSFDVEQGEMVAIVGANGAGKSTLMRALSGVVPIAEGQAIFDGAPVNGQAPHALVKRGIVHIPEGRGTLRHMTVWENLRLAHDMSASGGSFEAALEGIFARFPRLKERLAQAAGNLSGGEQQMLAIARALVHQPRLLLIDEPSLGLSPLLAREALAVLADFRRSGVTILLVEQNVKAALSLADRGYVLRTGEIVLSGTAKELSQHPEIQAHYLGVPTQRVPVPTSKEDA
jgi:branched-chain amino acid transport system ATP-binding protein